MYGRPVSNTATFGPPSRRRKRHPERRGERDQRLAERVRHQHGGPFGLHEVRRTPGDLCRDAFQVAKRCDGLARFAEAAKLREAVLERTKEAGVVHGQSDGAGERFYQDARRRRELTSSQPSHREHADAAAPQDQRDDQPGGERIHGRFADGAAPVHDGRAADAAQADRRDVCPRGLRHKLG
jgi:hypothetical protein